MIDLAPEVADALAEGQPVVALESTLIAHGLPSPLNFETARAAEAAIRAAGAVPATIAVLRGRIRVGIDEAGLVALAESRAVAKASRRDLAGLVAAGGDGATTVAATMICAHAAGIRVFATGGLGGVHRGGEGSLDVSADLDELARTPVAVVCSGIKAILDIERTMEVLETRGVPVLGFGTGDLPGFWARTSGFAVDRRVDDAVQVAAMLRVQWRLGLGGVVVANPPPEDVAMSPREVETAVLTALAAAVRDGVRGKAVTPYLLDRVAEITRGRSLTANVALIPENARVAAEIAVALGDAR